MVEITASGVYDIDADTYHADPVPGGSLSSSGARRLLPPGCPALFRYEQDHPQESTKAMELGTAAHKLVLGIGPKLVRIDAEKWNTDAIKAEVADVRAAGGIPLKPAQYEQVHDMAAALYRDDTARALLTPEHGVAEQSIFWQDTETEVWRRALIDWRQTVSYGPPTIVDYKSTDSADPGSIRSSVARHGYHQQAPWYLDAVESIGYPEDTGFKFIFQEKKPPYLVTVCELDETAMRIGHARNRRAIEIYRDCVAADIWPGHSTDIEVISLPAWAEYAEEYA